MSNNIKVLVVGAGMIAQEYIKILIAQKIEFLVVTRGEIKAKQLNSIYPQIRVISGGLNYFLRENDCPEYSIIATRAEDLFDLTKLLIVNKCRNILVEKPLAFSIKLVEEIMNLSRDCNSKINIAFNRRGFQSVLKAKELIKEDGGVSSFHFDFSEAIYRQSENDISSYHANSLNYWGINNSSHVIDAAFYLGGFPKWIKSKQYGNNIKWHPAGSIFTGLGETTDEVPFTYHANWLCPGKWNIEIMTPKRKLIFAPMERLKQQSLESFAIEDVAHDYSLDIDFKPGFHYQLQAFLLNKGLFDIKDLYIEMKVLNTIFNY